MLATDVRLNRFSSGVLLKKVIFAHHQPVTKYVFGDVLPIAAALLALLSQAINELDLTIYDLDISGFMI